MHDKTPQRCMKTVIAPIYKNKNGKISYGGNCWPISIATATLQLFEKYVLFCISRFVAPTDNHFDNKP